MRCGAGVVRMVGTVRVRVPAGALVGRWGSLIETGSANNERKAKR